MIKSDKHKVVSKIKFLEDRFMSLDNYLPETYQYLLCELDQQKYLLAQLEVQEYFDQVDDDESTDSQEAQDTNKNL
jgi:hypothetical protein